MAKRRAGKPSAKSPAPQPAASPAPYDVEFSEAAFREYEKLYRKMQEAENRGDRHSGHHTIFRMVEEVIKVFIPRNPVNKDYGLHGSLSEFFRVKKGRLRICWAASSQKRRVCILFISELSASRGMPATPMRFSRSWWPPENSIQL
jgi:mRNA-degrading endonuclease RelE of RelBE toxin-antitoxin system